MSSIDTDEIQSQIQAMNPLKRKEAVQNGEMFD
jgi:hypothetical protein